LWSRVEKRLTSETERDRSMLGHQSKESGIITTTMNIFDLISGIVKDAKRRVYCRINPVGYAKSIGVKVGNNCRLLDVDFGSEPYLIVLGDHVSATQVKFITHDGGVWVFRNKHRKADVIAGIKVGNNVFLGLGVTVLPGVTIGDNVVVGSGAIVAEDIPSNCVAIGVPARPIKTLDEYWTSIEPRIIPTKDMSSKEKRAYLIKRFKRTDLH